MYLSALCEQSRQTARVSRVCVARSPGGFAPFGGAGGGGCRLALGGRRGVTIGIRRRMKTTRVSTPDTRESYPNAQARGRFLCPLAAGRPADMRQRADQRPRNARVMARVPNPIHEIKMNFHDRLDVILILTTSA